MLSGPLRGERWVANAGNHAYLLGTYEREKQTLLFNVIGPNTVVFDIGAHLGFFSLLACSRGAQVVAVEPEPVNASFVARHLALNSYEGQVLEAAVAKGNGTAKFGRGPTSSMGSLSPEGMAVTTVTVDSLSERFGFPGVVKIDIEGGEVDALLGAGRTLQRSNFICVAAHSPSFRQSCLDILTDYGYEVRTLSDPNEALRGQARAARFLGWQNAARRSLVGKYFGIAEVSWMDAFDNSMGTTLASQSF